MPDCEYLSINKFLKSDRLMITDLNFTHMIYLSPDYSLKDFDERKGSMHHDLKYMHSINKLTMHT